MEKKHAKINYNPIAKMWRVVWDNGEQLLYGEVHIMCSSKTLIDEGGSAYLYVEYDQVIQESTQRLILT